MRSGCGVCRSLFFFFKQKTAYEISTRDWSSDVCSSDLSHRSVCVGRHHGKLCDTCRKRSEEHTSELQSRVDISYAVFCLKKKKQEYRTVGNMSDAEPTNVAARGRRA